MQKPEDQSDLIKIARLFEILIEIDQEQKRNERYGVDS